MTLALLSTAQHVSDVNTSIFRSLRLLVALCRLTWGVLVLCSRIVCWWCGIRVQTEPLLLVLCSGIVCWWCGIRVQAEPLLLVLCSGIVCWWCGIRVQAAVGKRQVLHILFVCSPSYTTCNVYAQYCHLWPAPFYSIFPHYDINSTICQIKNIYCTKMCGLIFPFVYVWKISHFKNSWSSNDQKCILVFM